MNTQTKDFGLTEDQLSRYNYLQVLRAQGCMTDAEKTELMDMASEMLTVVMNDNADVFMRLKDR